MRLGYTRIKNSQVPPLAAESRVLYDSSISPSPQSSGGVPVNVNQYNWAVFHLLVNQNTTNVIGIQYSMDKGVTWIGHGQLAITNAGTPANPFFTNLAEVYIGNFQHVRFLYVNGAISQTAYTCQITLQTDKTSSL